MEVQRVMSALPQSKLTFVLKHNRNCSSTEFMIITAGLHMHTFFALIVLNPDYCYYHI